MPPRRPSSPRADSSKPSPGGASKKDRTEIRAYPKRRHGEPPQGEEESHPSHSMENPAEEEEYHTSNRYPREEGDASEGTPVADDPRVVSKEMFALDDEEPLEEDDENPESTRAGPPFSLQVLEGPDRGRKRRFKTVRMVVGRAKDVDLKLTDQSVSRRHLEIIHGDSGTVLRDLGGATGTRVNGEPVEETTIKHGDEITIGRTKLKFVNELEAARLLREEEQKREEEAKKKKEEAEAKKKEEEVKAKEAAANPTADGKEAGEAKDGTQPQAAAGAPATGSDPLQDKKLLYYGAGGVGAVVLVVITIIMMVTGDPPPPPPANPKEVLATTKMQAARAAIRDGEYSKAVKLIEEAEGLKPGIDEEGLAASARAEAVVIEAFQEVRALVADGRFEEARQRLEAAPAGTTAKSDEERAALEKELGEAEVVFYTKRADELLDARDADGLRPVIPKLPANLQAAYREKLGDLELELAREAEEQAEQDKANKALAAKRAAERRAQFIRDAFEAVERKFENGDYDRAVLECDRVVEAHRADAQIRERARSLKRLIPQFARSFQDAQRKVSANSMETAIRPLRKSKELYQQIGFGGDMLDTLNEQLAEASVRAGKAALARNDIASASGHFREALRLNPSDARARDGLDSLESKAEELFQRAYIEKDRDPRSAAEKFRIVIDTVPEGSELRQKAQALLEELQP
ncbi:MAG: FHA domain-containing protein [Myxococcaceae bacterium]|nr:FHA domain-containing protein [Myxococcaceae bacterium]